MDKNRVKGFMDDEKNKDIHSKIKEALGKIITKDDIENCNSLHRDIVQLITIYVKDGMQPTLIPPVLRAIEGAAVGSIMDCIKKRSKDAGNPKENDS